MTYASLKLTSFASGVTRKELETSWTSSSCVKDLSQHARTWGPYAVRDWAIERGLTVHYVDNCWIRVPVTAELAGEFLRHTTGSDSDIPGLDQSELYVVEAEEF